MGIAQWRASRQAQARAHACGPRLPGVPQPASTHLHLLAPPAPSTVPCRSSIVRPPQVYQSPLHTSSVNSVGWAPYELGLALAAGSSDGAVSVLTYTPDGTWFAERIDGAHPVGCTAVSWAPAAPKGSLVASKAPGQPVRRLATAGCDNSVKARAFCGAQEGWGWDAGTKGCSICK